MKPRISAATLGMIAAFLGQPAWAQVAEAPSTVAATGVLVSDPLEMRSDKILQSIRSVADKPVTAIVYSHDHAHHNAGSPALLDALKGQAGRPRIIASQATADRMERPASGLPRPTETVPWPNGGFTFDLTVEFQMIAEYLYS